MEGVTRKDEECWEAMMENIDLLFAKVSTIGKYQQKMEATFEMSTKVVEKMLKDQQAMAKQIERTAQAVAQLILQQRRTREESPPSPTSSEATVDNPFQRGRPPEP